jgi:hypothetical protein
MRSFYAVWQGLENAWLCYDSNDLRLLTTPDFRREIRVGVCLFLVLLAALCCSLEEDRGESISLVPDPTNEGASRVLKKDVVVFALLIV